ncbi:arabinan endo-1,5-alpha-L-arabinosidase [Halalkalibaculum sp. DA3122]
MESVPSSLLLYCLCGLLLGIAGREALAQNRNIPVHDPVMISQDQTYYLFETGRGISVWSSPDLQNWTEENRVFDEAPHWTYQVVPDFRNHMWAPDIAYHDGTYYLYYSVSSFGKNTSAIGVATNNTLHPDDPDFRWVDHGPVVESVPGRDMWNAIDPNLAIDDKGTPWLTFGSYWLGIKLVKLQDNLTEVAVDTAAEWHTIASRHRYWKLDERDAGDSENGDIEAPFIFKKNGFYYLFVSWDRCCAGEESTYKVVVGRSKDITGPYLDRTNRDMRHGGGTLVVKGNENWAGIGHNSAYTFDGTDYLVVHGYDLSDEGRSKLIMLEMEWDEEGWPRVTPD